MGRPKGTRPPRAGLGRPKGIPNKSTRVMKEVFAELFKKTSADYEKWIYQVANGIKEFEPEKDENGQPVLDEHGNPKGEWTWLKVPDPEKATKLALEAAEFHQPKLSRTEHTGKDGEELPPMRVEFIGG